MNVGCDIREVESDDFYQVVVFAKDTVLICNTILFQLYFMFCMSR